MTRNIIAGHGGDWPEATKTGLAKAYQEMREDETTVMPLYADAPPHFAETGGSNYNLEKKSLNKTGTYGRTGRLFSDWTTAAQTLRTGPKKAVVFSIVEQGTTSSWTSYLYLSTVTGGALFTAKVTADTVSQLTLGLLLTWMGAGNAVKGDMTRVGKMEYVDSDNINEVKSETDSLFDKYCTKGFTPALNSNIDETPFCLNDMTLVLKVRGPSVRNFAKRYIDDDNYKKLAVDQLRRIIASKVTNISVNPIFGALWRTVCNDRTNEARDGLITMFGFEVDRISDVKERARMKTWLEESYNYAAEIQVLISAVPKNERFPVVFLDPTEDFAVTSSGNDDEDNRPLSEFTCAELLEIGRSCDYRILRRLGKVLTRLSYIEKEEDMPAHIKAADIEKVTQIPLAVANPKHDCKFWNILLHAVVPGTMFTARPSAVLAALALRMGIVPLQGVADQELLAFRDKWNTIDIPETWNTGCLSLLLDADRDYEKRVADGITERVNANTSILKEEDRRVFQTLVDYKMLEMNLKTTLHANIGWRPDKTKVALGPVVVCKACKFPRSVTIMGTSGVCGMCSSGRLVCLCKACARPEDYQERLKQNVSVYHNEKSLGYWVECSRAKCRAQYVVYNPDYLRVPAKCFYCRHEEGNAKEGPAPVIKCSKCLNRVIWPLEYRPANTDLTKFECYACTSDTVTIICQETTAQDPSRENGIDWILRNDDKAIHDTFNGRSLFYTASHCDLVHLHDKVEAIPIMDSSFLTIDGKLVRNQLEIKTSLQGWVTLRQAEAGVCSLCFSNIRKADLKRACGRTGCHQLVCNSCLQSWYGINERGRIINVAALSCPFCRRLPTPKTISAYGLTRLGNLRNAVEEAGAWIYAWCTDCGFARQYVERACAAGAPPELTDDWQCEECATPAPAPGGDETTIKGLECPGCG
ncbi:hypothetical protein FSARC_3338, partial [Fusarium sarcochroum]